MNREQAKQLLPIIQAFADGADVEFMNCGRWDGATCPTFADGREYRIKPKPLERWLVVDRDGDSRGELRGFFDESSARRTMERLRSEGSFYAPYRIVRLAEVTE